MSNTENKKPTLTAYQDIFKSTTPLNNEENSSEKIISVEISKLKPFANHPFVVTDNEEMTEFSESIKTQGIIVPIIIRQSDDNTYEILAGHRRVHAAKLAGLTEAPAIIKYVDTEMATKIMILTNKQRESTLPSELAHAYNLYYTEIKKKQGSRTDLSGELGHDTRKIAALNLGVSSSTLWRYICLSSLVPGLLEMVDDKKVGTGVAYLLSSLKQEEQNILFEFISANNIILKEVQAVNLKEASQEKPLTEAKIKELLKYKKPKTHKNVTIPYKKISTYFEAETPIKDIESLIFKLLSEHFEKEEGNSGNTG